MKRSMFVQIFVVALTVGIVSVTFFAFYASVTVRAASLTELTNGLQRLALTVRSVIESSHEEKGGAALQSDISRLAKEAGVRLTVIDPQGVVLADSEQDPATMENHRQRPEVAAALAGEIGVAQRMSTTVKRRMVYVAVPGAREVVRASYSADLFDRQVTALRLGILTFAAVLLGMCAAIAILFSRWLLTPLRQLTDVVHLFTGGDFGARLHLKRRDEVRELAESFNLMAERVQSLFAELSRRTEELDGVFSSVAQGIALLDKSTVIVRANRGFEELVAQKHVEGRPLRELFRAIPFLDLVDRTRREGPQPAEEARIGDRTIICSVARVAQGDNMIAILHDTTDVRRMEEVKRDFVVNASHELRTPLTAIQGFLEMIEGDVRGETARWVEIVRRNTDRMTAIVEDLLRLARLESKDTQLTLETVDAGRIVTDVVALFQAKAQAKGLRLVANRPQEASPVEADAFLLEQATVNLVDNAVKYTEAGSIEVSCAAEERELRIVVADTGIGIPPEHLGWIFERFYVVDKSRSRTMGGTGLGLSIVKHIVQLHGGVVAVESTLGVGTRFTLRLPLMRVQ